MLRTCQLLRRYFPFDNNLSLYRFNHRLTIWDGSYIRINAILHKINRAKIAIPGIRICLRCTRRRQCDAGCRIPPLAIWWAQQAETRELIVLRCGSTMFGIARVTFCARVWALLFYFYLVPRLTRQHLFPALVCQLILFRNFATAAQILSI